jgi:hypothetical protein
MAKRKSTKDKQRSTKHTHKTKDRVTSLLCNLQNILKERTFNYPNNLLYIFVLHLVHDIGFWNLNIFYYYKNRSDKLMALEVYSVPRRCLGPIQTPLWKHPFVNIIVILSLYHRKKSCYYIHESQMWIFEVPGM